MSKNITMEEIKDGNIQWNATSAKAFRAICAKYHNAKHSIKDNLGLTNETISNKHKQIKTNEGLISKLENGESIIGNKSVDDLRTENEKLQNEIDTLNEQKSAYIEKQKKDTDKLIEMLKSYVSAKDYKSATIESMTLVFAQFLADNGLVPCKNDITRIVDAWGKREGNSNVTAMSGKLNTMVSYTQWVNVSLNEIVDIMQDANVLDAHKYTFVPKSLRDKK